MSGSRTGPRTLLRGFDLVATFDGTGRELAGADVLIEGSTISAVGPGLVAGPGDAIVDCRGLIGLPGLINAHQHLYQGAFRAVPELERTPIQPWLSRLSSLVKERWRAGRFGPEVVRVVAEAVLAESLLGGQTTVADQHYFYPKGPSDGYVEATIEAADAVGIRLHVCRGSITAGVDPEVTQDVDEVIGHCASLVDRFHDPDRDAMVRVALAPCGVHVDHPALFEEMAAMAGDVEALRLHTHLYEEIDTIVCRDKYGCTPWEFLVRRGWAQPRTWLAHVVDAPVHEMAEMAAAGVGVAHLIAPDLRMGWGVAPVGEMLTAGIAVGFGTTGSASNDGANLLGDLRVAWLAHRRGSPDRWLSARTLLAVATTGSAACLGRPELGVISPGAQADLAAWDMTSVDRVGVHDPLIGLLATGLGSQASLVVVRGVIRVQHGRSTGFDEGELAARVRQALG